DCLPSFFAFVGWALLPVLSYFASLLQRDGQECPSYGLDTSPAHRSLRSPSPEAFIFQDDAAHVVEMGAIAQTFRRRDLARIFVAKLVRDWGSSLRFRSAAQGLATLAT
ncbi:MAG: hypothetical protein JWM11_33, partial [Planctomycetaceae bacterium]|nr:hypothetical protein [Planctomycetaceae bacterium]